MTAILDVRWRLTVLGAWRLNDPGRPVEVGPNGQRLLALLAVRGPCARSFVAGTLWPDCSDAHARGNLRATLSRLRLAGILGSVNGTLALADEVEVDLRRLELTLDGTPDRSALSTLCGGDLLPGWYDEWVVPERERLRVRRLHALEEMSARFLRIGDRAAAVEAGLAAVALEPLGEGGHRAVIRAHLAGGDRVAATRQFCKLRRMLRAELGIEPSAQVNDLFR